MGRSLMSTQEPGLESGMIRKIVADHEGIDAVLDWLHLLPELTVNLQQRR